MEAGLSSGEGGKWLVGSCPVLGSKSQAAVEMVAVVMTRAVRCTRGNVMQPGLDSPQAGIIAAGVMRHRVESCRLSGSEDTPHRGERRLQGATRSLLGHEGSLVLVW